MPESLLKLDVAIVAIFPAGFGFSHDPALHPLQWAGG
jgi:hypothetical protein